MWHWLGAMPTGKDSSRSGFSIRRSTTGGRRPVALCVGRFWRHPFSFFSLWWGRWGGPFCFLLLLLLLLFFFSSSSLSSYRFGRPFFFLFFFLFFDGITKGRQHLSQVIGFAFYPLPFAFPQIHQTTLLRLSRCRRGSALLLVMRVEEWCWCWEGFSFLYFSFFFVFVVWDGAIHHPHTALLPPTRRPTTYAWRSRMLHLVTLGNKGRSLVGSDDLHRHHPNHTFGARVLWIRRSGRGGGGGGRRRGHGAVSSRRRVFSMRFAFSFAPWWTPPLAVVHGWIIRAIEWIRCISCTRRTRRTTTTTRTSSRR